MQTVHATTREMEVWEQHKVKIMRLFRYTLKRTFPFFRDYDQKSLGISDSHFHSGMLLSLSRVCSARIYSLGFQDFDRFAAMALVNPDFRLAGYEIKREQKEKNTHREMASLSFWWFEKFA